jgi:hypothetical protein
MEDIQAAGSIRAQLLYTQTDTFTKPIDARTKTKILKSVENCLSSASINLFLFCAFRWTSFFVFLVIEVFYYLKDLKQN